MSNSCVCPARGRPGYLHENNCPAYVRVTSDDPLRELARKAVEAQDARKDEDVDTWAARLAADSVAAGEAEYGPDYPSNRRSETAIPEDAMSDGSSAAIRGRAGEVTVGDVAQDGTGPWKLFLGEYGVAQWPSEPANEEPETYAREVARVIREALADEEYGPVRRRPTATPDPYAEELLRVAIAAKEYVAKSEDTDAIEEDEDYRADAHEAWWALRTALDALDTVGEGRRERATPCPRCNGSGNDPEHFGRCGACQP